MFQVSHVVQDCACETNIEAVRLKCEIVKVGAEVAELLTESGLLRLRLGRRYGFRCDIVGIAIFANVQLQNCAFQNSQPHPKDSPRSSFLSQNRRFTNASQSSFESPEIRLLIAA